MREPKYNSIGFKDSFIDRDERKAARQAKRKKRREDWKNRNELTSYVVGQNEQGNDIIRVTTNKRKKRMEKKSDRDDRRNERKDKIKKSKREES